MATEIQTNIRSFREWLSNNTELESIKNRLFDEPSEGLSAWARTTAGLVVFLFSVQLLTGVLLAFHYVPSIESAYISVEYIEKVVPAGSWIRSLHYHSSVWLPLALIAHLIQMFLRRSYTRLYISWVFCLVLLALALAAATTGYALPWDARAFNGANVAASLAGHGPFMGATAQAWLLNGKEISTLTISRFYAMHVFLTPTLILLCIAARFFIFRNDTRRNFDTDQFREWTRKQLARNAIVIGIFFVFAAYYCSKHYAPFGPTIHEAGSYIPRPGPQFLWLFEMLKYLSSGAGSIAGVVVPGLIIGGLVSIPFLAKQRFIPLISNNHRLIGFLVFFMGLGLVIFLTSLAYWQDASDPNTSAQLVKQEKEEMNFRAAPFKPKSIQLGNLSNETKPNESVASSASGDEASTKNISEAPKAYATNCAKCHGKTGQGIAVFPAVTGLTTRKESPRSIQDLIGIINNPSAYGLDSKMPSFADKLTEQEKIDIANWMASLK